MANGICRKQGIAKMDNSDIKQHIEDIMNSKYEDKTPRIYVACLAAYNNGKLHGEWIDCDSGYDAIMDEINAMLKTSPEPNAEEWAIHDYEYFGGVKISEYESIEKVAEIAEFLAEHDELGALVLKNFLGDIEQAKEALEDDYQGEYSSLEDYAVDYMESSGMLESVPDSLKNYFDYGAYGRDLELGGDVYTIELNGNVHVFNNY